jgi:four helix bundle protein
LVSDFKPPGARGSVAQGLDTQDGGELLVHAQWQSSVRWRKTSTTRPELSVKDFRQLKVWQIAHQLTLGIYQATASFPQSETYGLRSQIRRTASSTPANLAEGCGREGDAELARFCVIARGSASELEYHLLLARDLRFIPDQRYTELNHQVIEIKRMLTGLVLKLKADR